MSIHVDQVRATLRRHAHYLPDVLRDDLARKFVADGLAHDGDPVSVVSAAATTKLGNSLSAAMSDPAKMAPARFAVGVLKRHGVDLAIAGDPVRLSEAMRAKGIDTENRMAVKAALHLVGVLD
jgi:hypothetical protein